MPKTISFVPSPLILRADPDVEVWRCSAVARQPSRQPVFLRPGVLLQLLVHCPAFRRDARGRLLPTNPATIRRLRPNIASSGTAAVNKMPRARELRSATHKADIVDVLGGSIYTAD